MVWRLSPKNMENEKYKRCPNCGRKGFYETENVFLEDKFAKCKYCDMEFGYAIRKSQKVLKGDVPAFF